MNAAERQRLYRERIRDGEAVIKVQVPIHNLRGALIRKGLITGETASNRAEIERVVAEMIESYVSEFGL